MLENQSKKVFKPVSTMSDTFEKFFTLVKLRLKFLAGIRELSRAAAELRLLVSLGVITIICGGKGITHQSEVLGK